MDGDSIEVSAGKGIVMPRQIWMVIGILAFGIGIALTTNANGDWRGGLVGIITILLGAVSISSAIYDYFKELKNLIIFYGTKEKTRL